MNNKVLMAYIKMISDGTAFSNWGEIPDAIFRQRIINKILNDNKLSFEDVQKLKMMKQLKKYVDEFLKEEDFKI
jgi:hypothetical protein